MKLDLPLKDLRNIARFIGMKNYTHLKKDELLYYLELYFSMQQNNQSSLVLDNERLRANAMERYYKGIYE